MASTLSSIGSVFKSNNTCTIPATSFLSGGFVFLVSYRFLNFFRLALRTLHDISLLFTEPRSHLLPKSYLNSATPKKVIKNLLKSNVERLSTIVNFQKLEESTINAISEVERDIQHLFEEFINMPVAENTASSAAKLGEDPAAIIQPNCAPGDWLFQKTLDIDANLLGIDKLFSTSLINDVEGYVNTFETQLGDTIKKEIIDIINISEGIFTADLNLLSQKPIKDILSPIMAPVWQAIEELITFTKNMVHPTFSLCQNIVDAIPLLIKNLDEPLDIPWFSAFYKGIFEEDLTILDLILLVASVPYTFIEDLSNISFSIDSQDFKGLDLNSSSILKIVSSIYTGFWTITNAAVDVSNIFEAEPALKIFSILADTSAFAALLFNGVASIDEITVDGIVFTSITGFVITLDFINIFYEFKKPKSLRCTAMSCISSMFGGIFFLYLMAIWVKSSPPHNNSQKFNYGSQLTLIFPTFYKVFVDIVPKGNYPVAIGFGIADLAFGFCGVGLFATSFRLPDITQVEANSITPGREEKIKIQVLVSA